MSTRRLPFVYIAALRRTGSTVLSEALTSLPQAFIFRCTDPAVQDEVKAFVESPLADMKTVVGHFNVSHPQRQEEFQIHGNQITGARVGRWKREENRQLLSEANEMFDLMPAYTEFWGYDR